MEESFLVRFLQLQGISTEDSWAILESEDFNLFGSNEQKNELIARYAGHPLALRIVAATVRDVFGSDVAAFLSLNTNGFQTINDVLDQQFNRLSSSEKKVMYYLTIDNNASIQKLRGKLIVSVSEDVLTIALQDLQHRSLVMKSMAGSFIVHPLIREYMAERIIENA